ncbi:MAG: hypothetical protein KY447_10730 [Actinobacteria bacterium]|nr:hypothetical protein [Actinomycetota bacterium]
MAGFQGRAAGEFPSVLAGQLDAVQAQVRVLEEVLARLEADVAKARHRRDRCWMPVCSGSGRAGG